MSLADSGKIARFEAERIIADVDRCVGANFSRLEAAGSFRRGKQEIGDIDLVGILAPAKDLWGNEYRHSQNVVADLIREKYKITKSGEKLISFEVPIRGESRTVNVELYMTTPDRWGIMFLIRTGNADFSHRLVSSSLMGGMLPEGYRVQDGYLWDGENKIHTPEEMDVFEAIGSPWIAPEERA